MTTLEEKRKEFDALQLAFDEYIASSQELEEELDADLTKYQNDLTKAESRNTGLASQLAEIQPQLNSLENKVSTLNTQLSSETQKRISAEMRTEEAENKLRELEGTLAAVRSNEVRKLKEENEELCERLAFVESEAEEYRNELNAERERHREQVEELKGDVDVLKDRLTERKEELDDLLKRDQGNIYAVKDDDDVKVVDHESGRSGTAKSIPDDEADLPPPPPAQSDAINGHREEYIRILEDEVEQVTEQSIEAEKKLSQTQVDLEKSSANKILENGGGSTAIGGAIGAATNNQQTDGVSELSSIIQLLQEENTALHEAKRLSKDKKTKFRLVRSKRSPVEDAAVAIPSAASPPSSSSRLSEDKKTKFRFVELLMSCNRSKQS